MSQPKKYPIAEIFYSLQGEGFNAGRPAVFVRFGGCNLRCTKAEQGFDCDTDFKAREWLTAAQIGAGHKEQRAHDYFIPQGVLQTARSQS